MIPVNKNAKYKYSPMSPPIPDTFTVDKINFLLTL